MKLKKRRKSGRMRGIRTHGHSAKLNKGSGSHGGKGMAGTGKRADHKKSLVIKLYGNKYFGSQGITSRSTQKDKHDVINIGEIGERYKEGSVDLSTYKILGDGEIKGKYIIKAQSASKSAIEKVKKAGGEIIIKKINEKVVKKEGKKEDKVSEEKILAVKK